VSQFLKIVEEYVRCELSSALSASQTHQLRMVFQGPPSSVLQELFEALTEDDGFVDLEVTYGEVKLPVYLLDSAAPPTTHMKSSICAQEHLVRVRTSDCQAFLVLLPPSEQINLSLETAMFHVGPSRNANSLDLWRSHPLIKRLLDEGVKRRCLHSQVTEALKLISQALEEAWEVDDKYRDKRTVWNLLRQLNDSALVDNPLHNQLAAILGYASCDSEDFGGKEHQGLNEQIARFIESKGIVAGISELLEAAEPELSEPLEAFRNHLIRRCRTPDIFSARPLGSYSPIEGLEQVSSPGWWSNLSVEVWRNLLDRPENLAPVDGPSVTVSNILAPRTGNSPYVVQEQPSFLIRNDTSISIRLEVSRAVGRKSFEQLAMVEVGGATEQTWGDSEPPKHDSNLRYRFEADGVKTVTIPVIALDSFIPGICVYSRTASQISQIKLNAKAIANDGKKVARYEWETKLRGMGSHQLDLFTSRHVKLGAEMLGYQTSAEEGDVAFIPVNQASENHFVSILQVDEQCYFEFEGVKGGAAQPYRFSVVTEDHLPTGVTSEFGRLVLENRRAKTNANVEPESNRLIDYVIWAIDEDISHCPVLFGPDYLSCWRKPDWASSPALTQYHLALDPRPLVSESKLPETLVAARAAVLKLLRPASGQQGVPIELHRLGEKMQAKEFSEAIEKYLEQYVSALNSHYDAAVWMDMIALLRREGNTNMLEATPYALLLSPLHPIRLAWQCRAQSVMKDALDRHEECPAASVLNSATFPDCLMLPCRNPTGTSSYKYYLAMENSSDYWSVLWDKDRIAEASSVSASTIFGEELGLHVEGLTAGFSAQQVDQSIREVQRLVSAKPRLGVAIHSETTGASDCNEGIRQWASSNLGQGGGNSERDAWYEFGRKSLDIFDFRDSVLHPEPSWLASLTKQNGASVQWYSASTDKCDERNDLALIAHLGTASPSVDLQQLRSSIDRTGLSRHRLRKQVAGTSPAFIAESRIGRFFTNDGSSALTRLLLSALEAVESRCAETFDSYVFAPRQDVLRTALSTSSYCAVSSSSVDTACFFGAHGEFYLWDYDLPSYGEKAGRGCGYYLLARLSPTLQGAVQTAVLRLKSGADFSLARAESLLLEVSARGMPTLKRLTAGGTTSFGEVGVLVAARILQRGSGQQLLLEGLIPAIQKEEFVNLVVPADPFQGQYEDLRRSLKFGDSKRPDLIVISVSLLSRSPVAMKITPIEVKARSKFMSSSERLEALGQAKSFSSLLKKIQELAAHSELWGVAWRDMVCNWVDYAFRVYGQLASFQSVEGWSRVHGELLERLMLAEIDIEVDGLGRLICIEATDSSTRVDVDGDGFLETIVLSHLNAFEIIDDEHCGLLGSLGKQLGDWGLHPREHAPVEDTTLDGAEMRKRAAEAIEGMSTGPDMPDAEEIRENQETACPRGIKFVVGQVLNSLTNDTLSFYPGNTALNQLNVGIVGDLGTGKTQLIQALIYQLVRAKEDNRGKPPRILIFDYKKDYSKPEFVAATGARVVKPHRIPLNFFDLRDSERPQAAWLERFKFFFDILSKIYGNIGPVQRETIKTAVRKSYEGQIDATCYPTIIDVFEAYKRENDGKVDVPYGIMSDIVDGEYFEPDSGRVEPFSAFLDGVVVVDLASVGQDDRTKNMLVVVFLNMFYEHMLKIQKREFLGKNPQVRFVDTLLLVDEADNIMKYEFDVLRKVLLQGREFGVGVLLASQYLSHFRTANENYLEPLLTWFIHKVPNVTVKDLQSVGLSGVDQSYIDRIKNLAQHECLYKTLDVSGSFMRGTPFYEQVCGSQVT
jgi:DNA phosphorothioation-dependent restriction protein DptH